MRRIFCVFLLVLLLFTGCSDAFEVTEAMAFREKLQKGNGCRFIANIQADYGDYEHFFSLSCQVDEKGILRFSVLQPQTIAGISGSIDNQSGKLLFDETVLHFPYLAEGEISPVSAPWLLYKAMLGGYIHAEGKDGDLFRITVDDSFQGESISFDFWLKKGSPVAAEVFWHERNVISLLISDFQIV